METLQFKTNIKCAGCVAKVTPFLNEVSGEGNWTVDVTQASKVLTVKTSASADAIKDAIQKAGFNGERISS